VIKRARARGPGCVQTRSGCIHLGVRACSAASIRHQGVVGNDVHAKFRRERAVAPLGVERTQDATGGKPRQVRPAREGENRGLRAVARTIATRPATEG
jgi:hypothetical protein